jgi:hypothetical protein
MNTPDYEDGDFSVAIAVTLPVFNAPFEGVNIQYVLTQEWMQNLADYTPLALDTPHPDYAAFILVSEGEQSDLGGGKVRWTRTYAKLPDEYTKPRGNFTFTFPGWSGLVYGGFVGYGGSNNGRIPLNKTVACLVTRTFYLTNDPATDIPILPKFVVTYGSGVITDYTNDDHGSFTDTTPNTTDYQASVAAGEYLVAQDSTWDIWMGNIYVRETFYVKYQ